MFNWFVTIAWSLWWPSDILTTVRLSIVSKYREYSLRFSNESRLGSSSMASFCFFVFGPRFWFAFQLEENEQIRWWSIHLSGWVFGWNGGMDEKVTRLPISSYSLRVTLGWSRDPVGCRSPGVPSLLSMKRLFTAAFWLIRKARLQSGAWHIMVIKGSSWVPAAD